tara:strand:+ start:924 stop:1382 length:459 start_codon:yes stop_codon:yes gene_type:complete
MDTIHALNSKECKRVHQVLERQFGFSGKLEYAFYRNRKGRIFIVTKDIAELPLDEYRINSLGLTFGTEMDDGIRLTIEGSQLIGKDSMHNILDLTKEELYSWLKGEELEVDTVLEGFVLIRSGDDFLGCGKVIGRRLINYTSKSRRLIVIND